jgi:arsenite methyltransferase
MEKKLQQKIKQTIRRTYGKIALQDNNNASSCCAPECCSGASPVQAATVVSYNTSELRSVPQASVLGVGCGAPVKFANPQKGETVVDLGSGAGIDVFLSANRVGKGGKVIGIDMTDEMLEKARKNAKDHGYANVEFRKGDIEKRIPVENDSADLVISNCVINLTTNKVKTFKEIQRILKNGGKMVISDLVSDRKIPKESVDLEKWSSCIDGTLTREDYIASIRKAGFQDITVLEERLYLEGEAVGGRKIISIVVKAVK